ncbi:MAG: RidA family protein [Eggerthellaceae bacterium]|nr:RidA family protein [Eggerthellaceae bacterium]
MEALKSKTPFQPSVIASQDKEDNVEKQIVSTTQAPAAIGPYVQAIVAGNTLYSSGQLGLVPEDGSLPEGIEAQARQSLANIDAILQSAGFSKADVVKTVVFLTDLSKFGVVNEIYAEYFGDSKPARSCVEVSRLPKDALVEIECIAYRA